MKDYFSPDGEHSDKETPTKQCTLCFGNGKLIATDKSGSSFTDCVRCGGSGVLDLEHEEILMNNESLNDHYAEQNED